MEKVDNIETYFFHCHFNEKGNPFVDNQGQNNIFAFQKTGDLSFEYCMKRKSISRSATNLNQLVKIFNKKQLKNKNKENLLFLKI